LIDLHTHTTASDGRCTPIALVSRASAAGVRVLAVTDHDTVAGCDTARTACAAMGLEFVPGIELTAARDGVDVHILGYFIDPESPALTGFLIEQRRGRIERVRRMIDRLAACGVALDADVILRPALADPSIAAGRPWIAHALVRAGYVQSTSDAFDRWLARGRPAFIPRMAPSPEQAVQRIHDAGGLASIAHPGLLGRDDWLSEFVRVGADAIEAYHADHDAEATARYVAAAARFGVAVSGGSDYHGDQSHGGAELGQVSLPEAAYRELVARKGGQT
jgi:predicted metal-dependent phosphoesterase TrpH